MWRQARNLIRIFGVGEERGGGGEKGGGRGILGHVTDTCTCIGVSHTKTYTNT